MPFDGSGNYSPPSAPTFPAVSGQVITASYYNSVITDIATALQNCLTRDGQGRPSADINWNAKDLTNVADFAATGTLTVGGTAAITGAATFGNTITVTDIADVLTMRVTSAAPTLELRSSTGPTRKSYIYHGSATLEIINEVTNGGISFAPNGAGIVSVAGSAIWHAGNDGASSGLDADLLDGVQGSDYARISTSNVFTGVANRFATSLAINGTGPFLSLANAANTVELGYLISDATNVTLANSVSGGTLALVTAGGGALTFNGSTVWYAGNDGASSGLDADLLDGVQGSAYALLSGPTFTGAPTSSLGYYINANTVFYKPSGTLVDISFDAGDVLRYDQSGNQADILIGSVSRFSVTAANSYVSGNIIWHAGNDGSGSGLDADLLDGAQGALYLKGSRTSQLVTDGTAAPSGGSDGDIYFQYV